MKLDVTQTHAVIGLLVSLGTLLGLLAAAFRFFFSPRIVQLVKDVVAAEFTSRDEAQQLQQRAEESALKELNGRMKALEERMGENEQASARTEATVQRIEEATKRQTLILEAIGEGITEIKLGNAVQKTEIDRAKKDIEELQKSTRRRVR